MQEICPLRSTWRGLESTWESASDVAGLLRMAPVLDPTDSALWATMIPTPTKHLNSVLRKVFVQRNRVYELCASSA